METAGLIIVILFAYFVGSIPTGYLVGLARGLDIRKEGSGNIGATNVFRVLGKPLGILVLIVDAAKGYLGAAVGAWIYWRFFGVADEQGLFSGYSKVPLLITGVGSVLGHNFSFWLKFKGGKGIATTAGALIAWAPLAFAVVISVWIVMAWLTRYVSVASIVAALVLPFAVWGFQKDLLMTMVATLISIMAIWKHKTNIQRLRRGEENKIGQRKGQKDAGS